MASVFGGETGKPLVMKAGKAVVTVNDKTMIALGVTVQFQRTVQEVPVLGSKKVMSVGEPNGTVQFETVLAKDVDSISAFKLDGNDCTPFDMKITFAGTCDMAGMTVTAKNCFSSGVTVSARGGQGYITNAVAITFTALEM